MGILREKESKYLLSFLICISIFISLLYGVNRWNCNRKIEQVVTIHNQMVAHEIMEESENVNINMMLSLDDFNIKASAVSDFLFLGCMIQFFIGIILYLKKREERYREALFVVEGYITGDFSKHLKKNEEGSFNQLLSSVENLSMALQSKSEVEHQAKEFLLERISDLSHQLKTPLSAIQMYDEIILQDADNEKTVKKFTNKSLLSVSRMEQLIALFLKMMRIDSGNAVFEKDDCQIGELVSHSIEDLKVRAKLEEKTITVTGCETEKIVCDFDWTSEAISNILKNALDHTSRGGHISISWERRVSMLRMEIRDDGCGISPEDIHFVFKRFYRSKNSDGKGFGLGLPLAKSIIEGQGGILTLESSIGEGTVFIISFLTNV